MAEAIEKDQTTLSETFTDSETARKLFVGGLSWQTTEDGLSRYLGSLGVEVERALIMRDKLTGRSRGFGFVIVKHQDMLDKAVSTTLQLDGRKIEAKRAIPKRDMEKLSKKLFVGGIPISLTQADFRKFFETFGTVAEAQVMTERESGRSRGFGFVTFHEDDAVEKVLAKTHSIQGKPVEVKRAEPKKVERTRPIILPVPAYFPTPGYPAYPMYASPAMYGQALAYDPSGYFVAQPMYAPQFVQTVEDPAAATTSYDQQQQQQIGYYDPSAGSSSASPNSSNSSSNSINNGTSSGSPNSENSSNKSPSDSNSGTNSKKPSRREVNTKRPENERWNSTEPSNSSLSLVDRVRVAQNEVRKRNGISDQVTERTKRLSSPVSGTPQIPTSRRTVATIASGSWRRTPATTTGTSATTSTTTTTTTSTTKEGGSLHKYFQ